MDVDYVPPKMRYFTGLDVGRTGEFSSLAVIEKTRGSSGSGDNRYALRHLKRFAVGSPYTAVVDGVVKAFAESLLRNSLLVVDITAVGSPFLRLLEGSGFKPASMP